MLGPGGRDTPARAAVTGHRNGTHAKCARGGSRASKPWLSGPMSQPCSALFFPGAPQIWSRWLRAKGTTRSLLGMCGVALPREYLSPPPSPLDCPRRAPADIADSLSESCCTGCAGWQRCASDTPGTHAGGRLGPSPRSWGEIRRFWPVPHLFQNCPGPIRAPQPQKAPSHRFAHPQRSSDANPPHPFQDSLIHR